MAPVQQKIHPGYGVVRSLVLWDGLVGCVRLDLGSDLFSWAGFGLRVIVGISLIYFLGPGHPVGRFAVQPTLLGLWGAVKVPDVRVSFSFGAGVGVCTRGGRWADRPRVAPVMP